MTQPKLREQIEWCDLWITDGDADRRPRVLLVGDSITKSYYEAVHARIGEQFALARLSTSKTACDPGFLRELDLMLDYRYAVIHFNNGLHGWDYTEEAYAEGVRAVVAHLRAQAMGAALVWANTTPVRSTDDLAQLAPRTARVQVRNRLTAAIMAEAGIPVNDLYAVLADRPDYFSPDGVHENAEGQHGLGAQVADAILAAAPV